MSCVFEIEKGIPVPDPGRNGIRESKYPFAKMEVGDSFVVPFGEGEGMDKISVQSRVNSSAGQASKRFAPKKFTSRTLVEGMRIWRVE